MSIRIIAPWASMYLPGYYGPICEKCTRPITFAKLRQRNGKCDECNGFKVHSCEKAFEVRNDPNIINSINNEFWLENGKWYGEVSDHYDMVEGLKMPPKHFELIFCPFCGIELKG